mmetsp:Transcript_25418/g.80175  ORF Transcript_25418/g.80175 Transcript_25418/m.80175 type:complete len:392 (-) Transcript_25418:786-1961(-)
MPAHELDEAYAVRVRRRLHVRGVDGLLRLLGRGVEAEGPVYERDVVVDGLGHADDGALVADLRHRLEGLHRALVRAVAPEHEVLPDLPLLQGLRDLRVRRVPAVAHEHAAAQHVDVLHVVLRELLPAVVHDAALVAADDAVDLLHPVRVQHLHDLADHGVEAGAEAAAGDDGRGGAGLLGVEVDDAARPPPEELQVLAGRGVGGVPALEGLRAPGLPDHALRAQELHDRARQVLGLEAAVEVHALQPRDLRARRQELRQGHGRGAAPHLLLVVGLRGVGEAVRLEAGLPRGEEHAVEPAAGGVHLLRHGRDRLNGKVDVSLVDLHRRGAGQPRHGAVHRVLRQGAAEDAVESVRLHGPHHVRRVDVLDRDGDLVCLAVAGDLLLQVWADVC